MHHLRLIFIFLIATTNCFGQHISFQKILNPSAGVGDVQSFDGRQTSDGAYILTGIGKFGGNASRPVMMKLDCKGNSIWAKNFATSSTIGNVFMRVIECSDGGYCMVNNVGQYNAYNILVVRTNKDGTTAWKKIINNAQGDDIGQCILQTKDGGFIIVGATNSYGTETVGGSYHDVYVVKLDANGNITWSKTIGNVSSIDEATAVVQTYDDGYAITGRYITTGAFYVMLLKLDAGGNFQFLKTFGDTNHANYGMAICQDANHDLLICGSTTLLQNSYQDYADHFVIRCNALGDTIWTKAYYGTNPNSFENPGSIFTESNGDIIVGANTASYPTIGFVPNKQIAMRLASNGTLVQAVAYNDGGSHYARCLPVIDGGYFISGFTTNFSAVNFRTDIIKTPTSLLNVCNTTDLTAITGTGNPAFKVYQPSYTIDSGAVIINSTYESNFALTDTTLCEFYPAIQAAFTASNSCANSPITFTSSTQGSVGYWWYFGNGDSAFSNTQTYTYTYPTTGTYTATLVVSNGCDKDTATQILQIGNPPTMVITQTPDPAVEGNIITLSTNVNANQYVWNTGSTNSAITITQGGLYYVTATINGCVVTDTIQVSIQPLGLTGTIYIPNIITPNGDGLNDFLDYYITGGYHFKSIAVYNRFGNRVFSSTDFNTKFRGYYNDKVLGNDVYYYYAVFTIGGKEEIRTGDVSVVR